MLSDLRESGAIEQDADVVCLSIVMIYYKDTRRKGYCGDHYRKTEKRPDRNSASCMAAAVYEIWKCEKCDFEELNLYASVVSDE